MGGLGGGDKIILSMNQMYWKVGIHECDAQ